MRYVAGAVFAILALIAGSVGLLVWSVDDNHLSDLDAELDAPVHVLQLASEGRVDSVRAALPELTASQQASVLFRAIAEGQLAVAVMLGDRGVPIYPNTFELLVTQMGEIDERMVEQTVTWLTEQGVDPCLAPAMNSQFHDIAEYASYINEGGSRIHTGNEHYLRWLIAECQ